MVDLDQAYPGYGFARHKGYGTKAHLEALKSFGPIEGQHRFTFAPVKKLIGS
jgi:ribonuclease HII